MSLTSKVKSFIKHYLSATNEHGVHSPFVFDLLNYVVYSKQEYYDFEKLNNFFDKVRNNEQTIQIIDLGAGSNKGNTKQKKIGEIAKVAGKNKKQGELLFKLVNYFNPENIIELGTSVGIGTTYLASANKKKSVYTIEGNPNVQFIAKKNFDLLQLKNIETITGNFDAELPKLLNEIATCDFVYFDGNHKKEPTLNYFNLCLKKHSAKSVFVFDDINWSAEMQEAWETIKNNEAVTVTVDLYYMGLVFFRTEQKKQHFKIRF